MPSSQRAAAVLRAHSGAQLQRGLRVWTSPDVLPWNAWVERELDAARARGESLPRRLGVAEEWLLWREALEVACSDHAVMRPEALIDAVRHAVGLLDDFGLTLTGASNPETAVLVVARRHFAARCRELSALSTSSWRLCTAWLTPGPHMLVAGFHPLAAARRQWLTQHGARVLDESESAPPEAAGHEAPRAPRDVPGGRAWDSADLEAQAAASWCADLLEADGSARVLVVVPRLPEKRHLWERAFAERLDAGMIVQGRHDSAESAFAIEGGQALCDAPLVTAALQLLSLAADEGDFEVLSGVLRSPYLTTLDRDQRLRTDLWLREQSIGWTGLATMRALLAPMRSALGEGAASMWERLISALEYEPAGRSGREAAPGSASGADWAQTFAQLLTSCGWPGSAELGSDEQQVRMRLDELLGELAAVAPQSGTFGRQAAYDCFRELAQRVAFEPATGDVPVTLTERLDDPIVRYDGIWVAGLSADVWPAAARPNPLIPVSLQLRAGVPSASATGQLALATTQLTQWNRAAGDLVLSWARNDADLPLEASPLLRPSQLPPSETGGDTSHQSTDTTSVLSLGEWLALQAPALEAYTDPTGPGWPSSRRLRGGTRLLELQSLCPFRAFSELRLSAQPLSEPTPGIGKALRGRILHRALHLFWSDIADQAALRALGAAERVERIGRCVQRALDELAGLVDAASRRRERRRDQALLEGLVEWELERTPFTIERLEWPQTYALGEHELALRLDRVDRLEDGRWAVLDYKSGDARPFDAWAPRPPQPQLPAYATVAGEITAAVAMVYPGRDGVKARGIADRAGRVLGTKVTADGESGWQDLLQRWRSQVRQLVEEYVAGHASVEPQPHACEHCHLPMLCRVDFATLRAHASSDTDTEESGGPSTGLEENSA